MILNEIAPQRVLQQQLAGTKMTTAAAIVEFMGAIQAQDYAMSKWALGIRAPGLSDADVEEAINAGRIIRTHILRPTWHLVLAEDLRWMLELTAPHVRAAMTGPLQRQGLDEKLVKRVSTLLAAALKGGRQLTREELVASFLPSGIKLSSLQAQLMMLRAELDGIVCSGPRRGKQFTYMLLEERLPAGQELQREEALAKLALRYFTSHGPASLQDFAWWSGLPAADAKIALGACRTRLSAGMVGGKEYWMAPDTSLERGNPEVVRFLPAFDEFTISYRDRSASLDPKFAGRAISANGIFYPTVMVGGKIIGTWKRIPKKDTIYIEPSFFLAKDMPGKGQLQAAAAALGNFAGTEVVLASPARSSKTR